MSAQALPLPDCYWCCVVARNRFLTSPTCSKEKLTSIALLDSHRPAVAAWPWLRCLVIALLVCLSACKPAQRPTAQETLQQMNAGGSNAVSISGYNFTNEGVQAFYVDGAWGSNLSPYVGGGSVCCAMLPNKWHEGMTVKVDWTIGHYTAPWEQRKNMSVADERKYCWSARTLQQTVPVQRYDESSTLQVFFLPDDKLEVWVFDAGPSNPEHPSKRGYPVNPNAPPKSHDAPASQEKQS